MKNTTIFLAALFWIAMPLLGQEQDPQSLNVYVHGRTGVQPLEKNEKKALKNNLKKKRKQAEKIRKDLEKQLKKQHGKKREQWPEEAQDRYAKVQEAENAVRYELDYMDCKQQEVDDSVQDLKESFVGKGFATEKKFVRLVDSPEEADLIVEILARRDKREFMQVIPSMFFVVAKFTPGKHLDSGRMAQIAPAGRWFRYVAGLHSYKTDEPYWTAEVKVDAAAGIGGWSSVGNEMAATINEFVEKNHAAFTAHLTSDQ